MRPSSDIAHIGLQTNISSPKSSPKTMSSYSPKTSPLTSPKISSRRSSGHAAIVEGEDAVGNNLEAAGGGYEPSPGPNAPPVECAVVAPMVLDGPGNLQAELEAAGVVMADPYDSEGVSGSVGTGSNVSLEDVLGSKRSGHSVHSHQVSCHSLSATSLGSHPEPVKEEDEKEEEEVQECL